MRGYCPIASIWYKVDPRRTLWGHIQHVSLTSYLAYVVRHNLNFAAQKTMAALSHGTPVISIQSVWYSHIAKMLSMDFCPTGMHCRTFREYQVLTPF